MIVYFTGTGNSRYAAQALADATGDELLDARPFLKNGERLELRSERPWVFVCPTYAWRIPRVFREQIEKGLFVGNRRAYFVMTCGDSIGRADEEIVRLCGRKGFTCMGVMPVVMPENYIAMFPVPGPEKAAKIIAAADRTLARAAAYLIGEKSFPEPVRRPGGRLLSRAANPFFYRAAVHDRDFYAGSGCSGCGLCVQLCPLNNITLKNGKPVWGGSCTHCMACICSCPARAIEYGRKSRGKPRYLCPEYTPKQP